MNGFVKIELIDGIYYSCFSVNECGFVFQSQAFVEGNSNLFQGNSSIIFGNFNRAVGDHLKVKGDYNVIVGSGVKVQGNHNIVCGNSNEAIGEGNIIYPKVLFGAYVSVCEISRQKLLAAISEDRLNDAHQAAFSALNDSWRRHMSSEDQIGERYGTQQIRWNPGPLSIERNLAHIYPPPSSGIFSSTSGQGSYEFSIVQPAAPFWAPSVKKTTDFSSIKNKTYPENAAQQEPKLCMLCEDRLADIIALPCRHKKFCGPCILEYQKQSNSKNPKTKMTVCPICKQDADSFSIVYE